MAWRFCDVKAKYLIHSTIVDETVVNNVLPDRYNDRLYFGTGVPAKILRVNNNFVGTNDEVIISTDTFELKYTYRQSGAYRYYGFLLTAIGVGTLHPEFGYSLGPVTSNSLTFLVDDDTHKAQILMNQIFEPDNFGSISEFMLGAIAEDVYNWIVDNTITDDPYSTDKDHTPSGGYGDFDYSGDDDLPPGLPTLSAAQVGFVSLWNPSVAEMKALANYLWTGTFDLTNFRKLFTDPMECILSVGIVPVTPTTGTATEIVFGGSSHSGVNAKPITSQFVSMDFGRLHVTGQSASALDYSPYAKANLFLPYCGTYSLDIDDIMDADIDLEYHIDVYTGACVAYVTITRTNSDGSTLHSTLYQFTGNVLATIPVTGADHSAFLQSLLFMGASVAATVATAGAGAPAIEGAAAAGDVGGAAALNAVTASSAVNTVMSMKPNVLRSGNLSSTAGLLGKQKPCLTITWSNLCRPEDENVLLGMPLHKSGTLSDFEGFTIVSAVHMDDILCTDAERRMIEQLLYKGVII